MKSQNKEIDNLISALVLADEEIEEWKKFKKQVKLKIKKIK